MRCLESLPADILLVVLESVESPLDFQALVLSSRIVNNAFACRVQSVYKHFILSKFSDFLPEIQSLVGFPTLERFMVQDIRHHQIDIEKHLDTYLEYLEDRRACIDGNELLKKFAPRDVFKLLCMIERSALNFFHSAAGAVPGPPRIAGADEAGSGVQHGSPGYPSCAEIHRLRRAFLRYELLCESLPAYHDSQPGTELARSRHILLTKLEDWEAEELECVRQYVINQHDATLKEMHAGFLQALEAASAKKPDEPATRLEFGTEEQSQTYYYSKDAYLPLPQDLITFSWLSSRRRGNGKLFRLGSEYDRKEYIKHTKKEVLAYTSSLAGLGLRFLNDFKRQDKASQHKFILKTFNRVINIRQVPNLFLYFPLGPARYEFWVNGLQLTPPCLEMNVDDAEYLEERASSPNYAWVVRNRFIRGNSVYSLLTRHGWIFWDKERVRCLEAHYRSIHERQRKLDDLDVTLNTVELTKQTARELERLFHRAGPDDPCDCSAQTWGSQESHLKYKFVIGELPRFT